jgi:chemotaxis protein MotB
MSSYGDEAPKTYSAPPWIVTFADLMVLLMCFFVLMLSFSEMDAQKFKLMSGAMHEAFGVQTTVLTDSPPKGTSLETQEFSPATPEPTDRNEVRQHTVDSDLNTLDLGSRPGSGSSRRRRSRPKNARSGSGSCSARKSRTAGS